MSVRFWSKVVILLIAHLKELPDSLCSTVIVNQRSWYGSLWRMFLNMLLLLLPLVGSFADGFEGAGRLLDIGGFRGCLKQLCSRYVLIMLTCDQVQNVNSALLVKLST